MAEISTESSKKGKKKGTKKVSTRVDLTPMVDLGFLLITFFMLTTTMIKPQTMEIAMPSRDNVPEEEQTKVKASRAITIILGKENKVFYYEGTRENEVDPQVKSTDFSATGIRKFLVERNIDVMLNMEKLDTERHTKEMSQEEYDKQKFNIISDKKAPIVIIKATDEATYRNLIDILDEMAICNIGRYAIVDLTDFDKELLATQNL